MNFKRTAGSLVAIMLACLWTYASQAHFTAQFTPDLAAGVDQMAEGVHEAFKFTGFSVEEVKNVFGAFGLLTAGLLFVPSTRRPGMVLGIIMASAARVYPQLSGPDPDAEPAAGAAIVIVFSAIGVFLLS